MGRRNLQLQGNEQGGEKVNFLVMDWAELRKFAKRHNVATGARTRGAVERDLIAILGRPDGE